MDESVSGWERLVLGHDVATGDDHKREKWEQETMSIAQLFKSRAGREVLQILEKRIVHLRGDSELPEAVLRYRAGQRDLICWFIEVAEKPPEEV